MMVYTKIVIVNQFQASMLFQVKVILSEYVLQALVVGVKLTSVTKNIMPPNFQCMTTANPKS